jgi:hypothetical protein
LAMWVPCAAHSLDFAGTTAAEKSVWWLLSFLVFYNLSNHVFTKLKERMMGNAHSVKSLSKTRWSSCYDAVKSLRNNYNEIWVALSDISECGRQSEQWFMNPNLWLRNLIVWKQY